MAARRSYGEWLHHSSANFAEQGVTIKMLVANPHKILLAGDLAALMRF